MAYWQELGFTDAPKVKIRPLREMQNAAVKKAIQQIGQRGVEQIDLAARFLGFWLHFE